MFDDDKTAGGSDSSADGKADDKADDTADDKTQDAAAADAKKADDTGGDDPVKKELRARANRLQDERDALLKDKQDRETADAKAKDEEAAKKGEFEQLAEKRGKELDTAKTDLAALTSENDQLKAAMAEGLTARIKDLPDPVRKVLDDTVAADDVLARWTWLHKPSVQELIKAEAAKADTDRGNGRDPKSRGDGKLPDADKQKSQSPLYRTF